MRLMIILKSFNYSYKGGEKRSMGVDGYPGGAKEKRRSIDRLFQETNLKLKYYLDFARHSFSSSALTILLHFFGSPRTTA